MMTDYPGTEGSLGSILAPSPMALAFLNNAFDFFNVLDVNVSLKLIILFKIFAIFIHFFTASAWQME